MNKGLNKDYLPEKKPKKPFYKRLWFITLIVVLIIVVFNNNKAKIGKYISNIPVLGDIYSELMFATGGEAFVWNDIAMSKVLPKPQSEVGHVYDNTAAKLSMYVKNYSYTEYEEYVAKCIDKGFDIDQYKKNESFCAFNAEGYEVIVEYRDYSEEIEITAYAPMEMEQFVWPTSEVAARLPIPESSIGKVTYDSAEGFRVYVGDTTVDDYDAYVELCKSVGFAVDYNKGDRYYRAYNVEGYYISLSYEGFNTMLINADAPEEPGPEATPIAKGANDFDDSEDIKDIQFRLIELGYLTGATDGIFGAGTETALKEFQEKNGLEATGIADEPTLTALESSNAVSKYGQEEKVETASATQGEELVDGMRPSVKKAIDSFEEYFVEYVELIEKIEADPDNPWLLVDYAEFLATYASTMRDFENMEDEDLNDAEMAYYLAALGRVNQMLINVTYEVDY